MAAHDEKHRKAGAIDGMEPNLVGRPEDGLGPY